MSKKTHLKKTIAGLLDDIETLRVVDFDITMLNPEQEVIPLNAESDDRFGFRQFEPGKKILYTLQIELERKG